MIVSCKGKPKLPDARQWDAFDVNAENFVVTSMIRNAALNKSSDYLIVEPQRTVPRTTSLDMYRPTPVYKDVTETKTVSKFKVEYPKIVFGKYVPNDLRHFILFFLVLVLISIFSIILITNPSFGLIFPLLFSSLNLLVILRWKSLNKELLLTGKFSLSRVKSVETKLKSRVVINQKDIDAFEKLTTLHDFYNPDMFFTGTATSLLFIKEKLRNHETLLTHEQLWFMDTCHEYLLELYYAYKLADNAGFNVKHEVRKSVRDSIVVFNERLDEIDKQISASLAEESSKKIKFVNACLDRVK